MSSVPVVLKPSLINPDPIANGILRLASALGEHKLELGVRIKGDRGKVLEVISALARLPQFERVADGEAKIFGVTIEW